MAAGKLENDPTYDDDLDEISGVHSARELDLGIALGARRAPVHGEPVPLYARPYAAVGSLRLPFARHYFLGTRFPNGVIEAPGWEAAMEEDALPPFMIERARAYLAGLDVDDDGPRTQRSAKPGAGRSATRRSRR